MQLANPELLWLFILLVPMIAWYVMRQHKSQPTIAMSSTEAFAKMPRTWKQYLRHFLFVLRLCAIACVIVVLARPQLKDQWSSSSAEGTDIIISLDISGSMLARDLKPNRIESAKKVANKFINGRDADNIGIVIFAGESLTGIPMTGDRVQLNNYIAEIKPGMLEDGTAIGDGIVTAINRLDEGKAKSKSIILITDGTNNSGITTPLDAAAVAKEEGIKIYTIGVGTNGMAEYPTYDHFGRITYTQQEVVIDEATLRSIAEVTNGKYYRATDNESLQNIFKEIDALEKTKMDVKVFSQAEDNYMMWAWFAFGFFLFELLLRYLFLRPLP